MLARLAARFGPRNWYEELLEADLLTELLGDDPGEPMRQCTLLILERWLSSRDAGFAGAEIDDLRRTVAALRELAA